MKPFLINLLAGIWSLSAAAQGYIGFANHVPGEIDAPVFDTDCQTRLQGAAFSWQVYAGLTPDSLRPLGEVGEFRTGAAAAGYIPSTSFQMPGGPPLSTVYTQLRAWRASAGSSYEAAVSSGGGYGFSNIVPEVARVVDQNPEFPVGLQSFCLLPEPSPLFLFGFAAVSGLILRRMTRAKILAQ